MLNKKAQMSRTCLEKAIAVEQPERGYNLCRLFMVSCKLFFIKSVLAWIAFLPCLLKIRYFWTDKPQETMSGLGNYSH